MTEREEETRCSGCPYNHLPELDSDTWEVIDLYQQINTPVGAALSETILEAYYPKLTRFEFLRLSRGMNDVHFKLNEPRTIEHTKI